MNKDNRSRALENICKAFHDVEKPPTKAQVQLKITRLRSYYNAENNKIEKSKTSGGDLESVHVPTWKFFNVLEFLKDNLLVRPTISNLDLIDDSEPSQLYNTDNPLSAKLVRKIAKAQKSNAEDVMKTATRALQKISSRYENKSNEAAKVIIDEDKNLSEMIYAMLISIPDGMPKAMLRLELHQKIVQVKYNATFQLSVSSTPSPCQSPNLLSGLQSPNMSGMSSTQTAPGRLAPMFNPFRTF